MDMCDDMWSVSWCSVWGGLSIPGKSERAKKKRKRKKEWTAHRTAVSQGIKLSLYLVSVCLAGTTRKTEGDILLPEWNNIQADTTVSSPLLSFSLTLSTVISSSASAVVSSSSLLACCSWPSRAWRAACRLLICDSRSCSDSVSSVTWRLISSFCSSCSSPICKGETEKQGAFRVRKEGRRKWFTPKEQTLTHKLYDCTLICCAGLFCYIWIKSVLFCPELRNYDKVVDQHQWLLEMRFLMRPGNMWILYLQSDKRLYMFLYLGYYYMGMWHKRCLFLVLNASLQSSDVVFWTVLPALMFAFIHLVIISISLIVLFII